MTLDQAVAILEAERILQYVGAEGPNSVPGTAWNDYVQKAGAIIQADKFWCSAFDDLHLLDDVTDSKDLWRCPHCEDVVVVESDYDDIPFCADCDTQRDRFDPIDVVFLRDKGGIYAVFPGLAATDVLVTCYTHVGQHSGCALWYCDDCTEVTHPAEYADLFAELDHIGYNLHVVSKDCLHDAEYADSRRAQLQEGCNDEDC